MGDWADFVDIVEEVMADDELLPQVVSGVRAMIHEVATLPVNDMSGHTRALLTAAARAMAARRGPTEAELAFVEELAVTRASQGIGIEVVLGAIHVAERQVWVKAREKAEAAGLSASLLLDARELYDDWAGEVRARLLKAHAETSASLRGPGRDRHMELLKRFLDGGSAASLAAAEAGFAPSANLWVLVTRLSGRGVDDRLRRLGADRGVALKGVVADAVVAVCDTPPRQVSTEAEPGHLPDRTVVAVVGPVTADEVGAAYRRAVAVVPAAERLGRSGMVHVSEVAAAVAVLGRVDLTEDLLTRHAAAQRELAASLEAVATAVVAWLTHDRDTTAAGEALFVHANTIRNRLQRFTSLTGIDPSSTFGGIEAWWLCDAWLTQVE